MLTTIGRIEGDEEGFTLIELMVVVLIIAILLAIAIPTFLGARTRAQDRAAQSNIRNALTAEKTTYFADKQAYAGADVPVELAALISIEPAIGWTDTVAAAALTAGKVGLVASAQNTAATRDNIVLGAKSASGTCFYEMDESTAATGLVAPGTFYSISTDCTVPPTGPTPAAAAAGLPKAVSRAGAGPWGSSF
jgi:type IV pilus assembly protein PilA